MVPAPGRVSITLGCPQASVNFCPMMRATRSTEPPGANGTMILIGFSGYLSADCAWPAHAKSEATVRPRPIAHALRRTFLIIVSPSEIVDRFRASDGRHRQNGVNIGLFCHIEPRHTIGQ